MQLTLKSLKLWALVLPIVFLVGLQLLQYFFLEPRFSREAVHLTIAAIIIVGVILFSTFVWRAVERIEGELKRAYEAERLQSAQLAALHEAALQITSERTSKAVLQKVVELSCQVIGSKYGALAVLGPDGAIDEFYTSGIDEETLAKLGPPPKGHGILALVTETRTPLRLDDISQHPRSVGFPPHHPVMRTLLAVPVIFKDRILGNLYLSEKLNGEPFTPQDQQTLERFAAQAAIAIANAHLYEEVQRLSVVEERERIAMDLHDGVIQSIYAVELALENAADLIDDRPDEVKAQLDEAIDRLGAIVADIRHYILDLRSHRLADKAFPALLKRLLESAGTGPDVEKVMHVDGEFGDMSRRQQWELWHIVHEALTNAVRHAEATRLEIRLRREGDRARIEVRDNGKGFVVDRVPTEDEAGQHQGLANMRRRTRALHGELRVESAPGKGTVVIVDVPVHHDELAWEA